MTTSAAILTGGRGTRFGNRNKSALVVAGRPIIERQIEELATITTDILIVGGAEGRTLWPARALSDRIPGRGPLGGVHTALLESSGDVTIVVACDMPFVSAPLLLHLAALAQGVDVAVPRTGRGYHPLCAAYTRACLQPAALRIAQGRLKLTDLFEGLRVREVDTEELQRFGDHERLLANINTPEEYGSICRLQGSER
jgi:molybdopterin-guanine dinucleotide biosynthesis protein A